MKRTFDAIIFCFLAVFLFCFANTGLARCAFVDDKIEQLVKEGDSLIGDAKYEEALEKYREASDMNTEKAVPHYKMGVAYYFLKEYKKAIESYKKAIKADPKMVKALNNLALIYDKQGEDAEAVIMYKRALDLEPDYKIARYNLAALYIRMEKLEEAEKEVKTLLEMDDKYYKAYYLMGMIYEFREKYFQAEEMYLKTLSVNADFSKAAMGMKRVKENMERNSAYKKELNKAMMIVRFKLLPEYKFMNIEETVSGCKVVSLKYGEDQDVMMVKLPDSHVLGEKSLEELVQDEKKEDFTNLMKDLGITSVELTGAGRFKEQETEPAESKKGTGESDAEVKRVDKNGNIVEETPTKKINSQSFKKTREYINIKCIFLGSDREGIMLAFKPAANMNRMLFISLAPMDKFSLSAARSFYNHITAPE